MARAGRVRGIRPKGALRENAIRVVATRLDELLSWRGALTDPTRVRELHDMRIAAKRLRYAFEMFEVCFPGTRPLLRELTDMQEDLGTIHDLDVLADSLRQRFAALDVPLEARAIEIAATSATPAQRSNRLRAVLYGQARDRRRLGLLGLLGERIEERRRRYDTFVERWGDSRLDDFARRVHHAISPPPGGAEGENPGTGNSESAAALPPSQDPSEAVRTPA